jgi:hypothetical protein
MTASSHTTIIQQSNLRSKGEIRYISTRLKWIRSNPGIPSCELCTGLDTMDGHMSRWDPEMDAWGPKGNHCRRLSSMRKMGRVRGVSKFPKHGGQVAFPEGRRHPKRWNSLEQERKQGAEA